MLNSIWNSTSPVMTILICIVLKYSRKMKKQLKGVKRKSFNKGEKNDKPTNISLINYIKQPRIT